VFSRHADRFPREAEGERGDAYWLFTVPRVCSTQIENHLFVDTDLSEVIIENRLPFVLVVAFVSRRNGCVSGEDRFSTSLGQGVFE
jgi:hypothetical protein